jgi:2-methylisocitrate lyase-like PEP mutase family enzyme
MATNRNARDYPPGLAPVAGRNARLRRLLDDGRIVVAPGAFDCITARLVDQAGFPALYVTGYGGPLNVIRTVRDYERTGVSAIQIEDQAWPKKCGHEAGRRLVEEEEMTGRIKAAADARDDEDFLIIARTDARTTLGIDAAIDRALACREAGADVLFVEAPESEAEMALINERIGTPTLVNMVEGGQTPFLPADRLAGLGYAIAIFPNSLTRLLGHVGQEMLAALKSEGTTAAWHNRMLDHRGLWNLFDYEDWLSVEGRFTGTGGGQP